MKTRPEKAERASTWYWLCLREAYPPAKSPVPQTRAESRPKRMPRMEEGRNKVRSFPGCLQKNFHKNVIYYFPKIIINRVSTLNSDYNSIHSGNQIKKWEEFMEPNWWLEALKKWRLTSVRAMRKEYWYFNLIYAALLLLSYLIMPLLKNSNSSDSTALSIFSIIYFLVIFVLFFPALGVAVRRLHDTNRSAWWLLIGLIPYIGSFVLLIFYLMEGTPGENKYGPDPREIKYNVSYAPNSLKSFW